LTSFAKAIVQKLEPLTEEWSNGEEMRARKKDWGGAVNSTIFLGAETEYKENKNNDESKDRSSGPVKTPFSEVVWYHSD